MQPEPRVKLLVCTVSLPRPNTLSREGSRLREGAEEPGHAFPTASRPGEPWQATGKAKALESTMWGQHSATSPRRGATGRVTTRPQLRPGPLAEEAGIWGRVSQGGAESPGEEREAESRTLDTGERECYRRGAGGRLLCGSASPLCPDKDRQQARAPTVTRWKVLAQASLPPPGEVLCFGCTFTDNMTLFSTAPGAALQRDEPRSCPPQKMRDEPVGVKAAPPQVEGRSWRGQAPRCRGSGAGRWRRPGGRVGHASGPGTGPRPRAQGGGSTGAGPGAKCDCPVV